MKRWFRRLVVLSAAALVLGAIAYAFRPQPIGVDVATVERGTLQVAVEEEGKTRIKERYVVSSPLAGRLLRIELKAGDRVVAGNTLLARIEPTDPALLDPRAQAEAEARVKAAEARLQQTTTEQEKALANLQFAEAELGRARQLFEAHSLSATQFEDKLLQQRARTQEYRSARFAEDIARYELELARAALLRTRTESNSQAEAANWFFHIHTPITGRVLRVFQESATVVSPGTALLELGDERDLEVVAEVLSRDAVNIHSGDKVLLEEWGGEKPLRGTVRLVEPSGFTKISALGVEEQRVNVIVDFDEPADARGGLGDGFRVEARIIVWEGRNVLKVPTGALFRHAGRWAVFVLEQGRAVLRPVELGRRNGFEAEVRSGLRAGEQVIVHPSDQVADGAAVFAR